MGLMYLSNKQVFFSPCNRAFLVAVSTFVATASWAAPDPSVLDDSHASVRAVIAVQGEVTPDLMKTPEILGTAVGLGDGGEPALVIYVDRDGHGVADLVRSLPPQMRGVAVRAQLTDKFRAYAK